MTRNYSTSPFTTTDGISIPHTTGTFAGVDWRYADPLVEPVVELYQGARVSYEHPGAPRALRSFEDFWDYREQGFVWNAFRKGHRLGVIASSDHCSTHISYAMVYTDEPTREGIFKAIRKRHTYAATDNIVLDFRIGSYFMGDESDHQTAASLAGASCRNEPDRAHRYHPG